MKKCGNCQYWLYDTTDRQDSSHAAQDRRPCSLAIGTSIGKGTYFHSSTKACNKHSGENKGYKVG